MLLKGPTLEPDAFSRAIALRTCWGEARGEPEEGQLAVMAVICNRAWTRRWGVSLASVCLAPFQFSCWNDSDPERRLLGGVPDKEPALAALSALLDRALAGADPTNGALYYRVSTMALPTWAQAPVQIGRHTFYTEKKDSAA